MKKILMLVCFSLIMFLVPSCTTTVPYDNPNVTVRLAEMDYEVVGPVSVEGVHRNILGLFWWGGASYESLLEEARKMGADDVINIYEDKKKLIAAIFYNESTTKLHGIAIKYKGTIEKTSE